MSTGERPDGVALNSMAHPEGSGLIEESGIAPSSLETVELDAYEFAARIIAGSPTLLRMIADGVVTREKAVEEMGDMIAAQWRRERA